MDSPPSLHSCTEALTSHVVVSGGGTLEGLGAVMSGGAFVIGFVPLEEKTRACSLSSCPGRQKSAGQEESSYQNACQPAP